MKSLADISDLGYNIVFFNHLAPPGETNCRLMDFSKTEYLDEVIEYADKRFGDAESEIILIGFSLGGNHILRYLGYS